MAELTIAVQHSLAASYLPAFLKRLHQLESAPNFRIRSENRSDAVAMLMRGQAEILVAYETAQSSCNIPSPMAMRQVLGNDQMVLVSNPSLQASLTASRRETPSLPMLCYPPESFLGQVLRFEVLPELMRRQQVAVRCVSEFAMGLRELALVGQGAAWLPRLLVADDLKRGRLVPLESLGRSVAMDIVAYFAVRFGDKGDLLKRQFQALHGEARREAGGAAKPSLLAKEPRHLRDTRQGVARGRATGK